MNVCICENHKSIWLNGIHQKAASFRFAAAGHQHMFTLNIGIYLLSNPGWIVRNPANENRTFAFDWNLWKRCHNTRYSSIAAAMNYIIDIDSFSFIFCSNITLNWIKINIYIIFDQLIFSFSYSILAFHNLCEFITYSISKFMFFLLLSTSYSIPFVCNLNLFLFKPWAFSIVR